MTTRRITIDTYVLYLILSLSLHSSLFFSYPSPSFREIQIKADHPASYSSSSFFHLAFQFHSLLFTTHSRIFVFHAQVRWSYKHVATHTTSNRLVKLFILSLSALSLPLPSRTSSSIILFTKSNFTTTTILPRKDYNLDTQIGIPRSDFVYIRVQLVTSIFK